MFADLVRIVAGFGLAVPPAVAAVFRALATGEGTLTALAPGFDVVVEARRFASEGRPVRARDLTIRPAWTFAKLYLGKQGFRDGLEGFLFCALSGMSVAVRHWKHREMLGRGGAA